jgi:transposase
MRKRDGRSVPDAALAQVRRRRRRTVSYFGLNPRVRQSGLGLAQHGRISKIGRAHARALLVEAAWAAAKGFCQVSRHRPWLTRAGLAIWPVLMAGWMGCGA